MSLDKAALAWDARVPSLHIEDPDVREGLSAYASRQAESRRCLIQTFRKMWDMPITEVAQYTMDDDQGEDELIVPMPEVAGAGM